MFDQPRGFPAELHGVRRTSGDDGASRAESHAGDGGDAMQSNRRALMVSRNPLLVWIILAMVWVLILLVLR